MVFSKIIVTLDAPAAKINVKFKEMESMAEELQLAIEQTVAEYYLKAEELGLTITITDE